MIKLDQVVAKYVALRDRRDALKKEFEAKDAELDEAMATLAEWMTKHLAAEGVESARLETGTVFFTTKDRIQVDDWAMFSAYILEQERTDLLERRPAKNAIKELMGPNRDGTFTSPPPPGTQLVRWKEIQVNRPKGA